jgi:hypothetical protein
MSHLPFFSLSHEHSSRQCHAPLASRTKSRANQLVQSMILVCIRHDHTMIFGPQIRLNENEEKSK